MRVAKLLDILRGYPQEWEVRLAVPGVEVDSLQLLVDHYSVEAVLPWQEDGSDEKLLFLVGGEEDLVDDFLDEYDTED
jgi:hypothetical protein